jgi:hypothetical protein
MAYVTSGRIIIAAAAFGFVAAASASVSDPALIIRAQSGANVDVFSVPLASLAGGAEVGSLQYSLPGSLTLPNTGTRIQSLNLSYVPENALPIQDNVISLGFTLWTGDSTTTFTISTGEFTLPGAPAVIARASANVGISDGHLFAFPDGVADYTGGFGGGGYYTQTNGWFGGDPTYTPAGTAFGVIGPAALSAPFGSDSDGGSIPNTVLGAVGTSMSAQWSFSLSGGDQIGVTSTFTSSSIIPAPASASLLGLGGLLAARRRR